MLREQNVMAHAQADHDVELGLRAVQYLRLPQRIAEHLLAAFLRIRGQYIVFIHTGHAAAHGCYLECVRKQCVQDFGLVAAGDTEGNAQVPVAHPLREPGQLLDAGQKPVALVGQPLGRHHYFLYFRVIILLDAVIFDPEAVLAGDITLKPFAHTALHFFTPVV